MICITPLFFKLTSTKSIIFLEFICTEGGRIMSKLLSSNKFRVLIILLAICIAGGIGIYKSKSTKLLDRDLFSAFSSEIEDICEPEAGGFADQRALMDFIENWADSLSLEYTEDESGNIIFDKPAVGRKTNVTPTLIAVSMNYETAGDNPCILASAAAIAASDVESGRCTVVFFNDEQGLAKGYKGLDKSYLSSKSKVIYLDKGSANYISTGSFQQRYSEIDVPAAREENPCDTAVRVSIKGIKSGVISTGINKQPDPISALSSLLTRLKSKSTECRLAEVSIGSNGNMYPVSLEATITLNSYNLASFTGYIDKRIKAWEKAYSEDHPDLEYSYEVIDDPESLPETVYTAETFEKLTGILYTVKSGTYRYSEGDTLPEGKETGDAYGINCTYGLSADDEQIKISLITQGVNDSYTDRIYNDNKVATQLYECGFEDKGKVDAFENTRNSLSRTFKKTYTTVNDASSAESIIDYETDNFFTPCSYLAAKNKKADIIHIRTKSSSAAAIANTILCYIKTKGNTSIFK